MNIKPALPADHPHRRLCLLVFERVSKSPVWTAYKAGMLGRDIVEMAVKATALDIIASQGSDVGYDLGKSIADAIILAIGIAQE